MSIRTRRTLFSLIVFFAVCALGGMVLSQQVGAQSAQDESTFRDGLKSFSAVYDIVAKNYAEPLTGDMPDKAIYDGAIPEMLHTLDPHSSFYDPKAYARMKEDQHGKYYGVGMLIVQQNGKVVVVNPIESSPAFRAGIHPGDVITSIDGQSANGMTSDDVANRRTDVVDLVSRYTGERAMRLVVERLEIDVLADHPRQPVVAAASRARAAPKSTSP